MPPSIQRVARFLVGFHVAGLHVMTFYEVESSNLTRMALKNHPTSFSMSFYNCS